MPELAPQWLAVGHVSKPHGVHGELVVEVLTDFPERLQPGIEVGVGPERYASQVERERRAELAGRMCARPMRVTGTLGYEKAEVTAGGVALDEVDASTLESRKAQGVFLCGEMLDVDGRLGGFNFQWAWSSGTVAGRGATILRTTP